MSIKSRFGAWVRDHRENTKCMTQEELAARARKYVEKDSRGRSVSSAYIANIESGQRDQPSVEVVQAIAKALTQPVDLAMFLSGRVPDHWLEGSLEDIVDRFNDLQRLAMGSPAVIRDKEKFPRTKVKTNAESRDPTAESHG